MAVKFRFQKVVNQWIELKSKPEAMTALFPMELSVVLGPRSW